jgi:hypothetical protein
LALFLRLLFSIVITARIRRAGIALLVAMVTATSTSMAAQALHQWCLGDQPDCGKTTRVTDCCCGIALEVLPTPAVTEANAPLTVDDAGLAHGVVVGEDFLKPNHRTLCATHHAHERPPDLPILLADLRL